MYISIFFVYPLALMMFYSKEMRGLVFVQKKEDDLDGNINENESSDHDK